MSLTENNDRGEVLSALRGVLTAENSLSRCWAVRALPRLGAGDDETAQRLVGLLSDPDPDVRMEAAAALGEMKVVAGAKPLIETMTSDPEGEVRIQAVGALAKIRSPDSVQPLIDCVRANGYAELDLMVDDLEFGFCWEVQSRAMAALGDIADPEAANAIMELLEDDEYQDLRDAGYRILARLNTPRSRAFLLEQLKQGDRRARRWAAQALAQLPDSNPGMRDLPAEVLGGLVEALIDPEPAVRIAAARSLKGITNPLVLVPITLLLNDPDAQVREEVINVLSQARGPEIVVRLHDLMTESDPRLQARIATILGEIGDPGSSGPISELLGGDDENLNYAVVRALGQLAVPGVEAGLAELLAETKTPVPVRIQAAVALGRILANVSAGEDQDEPEDVLCANVLDPVEAVGVVSLKALVDACPDRAETRLIAVLDGRSLLAEDADAEVKSDVEVEPDAEDTTGSEVDAVEGHESAIDGDPETSTLASILAGLPGQEPPGPVESSSEQPSEPGRDHTALKVVAANLLGELPEPGTPVVRALRSAFDTAGDPRLREAALRALTTIGGEEACAVVIEALGAGEPAAKLAALDGLADVLSSAEVSKHLGELLIDPEPVVRARAITVLGAAAGPPPGMSELPEQFCQALGDESATVCRSALEAFSEDARSRESVEQVFKLLFRFSAELRHPAAQALRRAHDTSSTPRLLEILGDPEQEEFHWICIDALADLHAMDSMSVH